MMIAFAAGFVWMPGASSQEPTALIEGAKKFIPFSLFSDPKYTPLEIRRY